MNTNKKNSDFVYLKFILIISCINQNLFFLSNFGFWAWSMYFPLPMVFALSENLTISRMEMAQLFYILYLVSSSIGFEHKNI